MKRSEGGPVQKKLLILTTYFPPQTEIAAARLKNIIRRLLRLSWDICCVAPVDLSYDYAADEVLGKITLIAAGTTARVPGLRAAASGRRTLYGSLQDLVAGSPLGKPAKGLLHAFRTARWCRKAYALSLQAISRYLIGTVLVTVPGIEAAYVGGKLKRRVKDLRLFCEYRDLISDNRIYGEFYSRLENAVMRKMEKAAIRAVDRFIYLTPEIKHVYGQYVHYNAAIPDGIVLTNGYDRESYPDLLPSAGKEDRLVISHVGHFYGSRSATNFVSALALLEEQEPQLARSLHVRFIGKTEAAMRGEIERICVKLRLVRVSFSEPVPHRQALEIMMRTDVNLVITHRTGSEYAIPGKIFEYIGAGRPILAVTSDPLLIKLMREENLGWVCPDEPEAILRCLITVCALWLEDRLEPISGADKFELSRIVKKLDSYLLGDEIRAQALR